MRTLLLRGIAALTLTLAGCDGGSTGPEDGGGGTDGGRADSGVRDGGRTDGGGTDAGTRDAGGGTDAGPPDGGTETCSTTLPPITTETVVSGLQQPVYVTQPPGVTDALYVVEKTGRIQIVRGGAVVGTFLNLRSTICGTTCDRVPAFDERGLLGLAFHPDYATNGRFFVYFAPLVGDDENIVQEFARSAADPQVANPTPVRTLLDVPDPATNHNGGMLAFGPDGYLYVATGDGGSGCDPFGGTGNGQNLGSPHGKLHRLDVDAAAPYAAPGNPFTAAGQTTIWAYGLRNPWRFSFDRTTGDLWIGDVGQDAYEEIDFQPASSTGGQNYGWRVMEGLCSSRSSGCTSTVSGCLTPDEHRARSFVPPVFVASHSGEDVLSRPGSIVGGYVYRGSAIPGLRGFYLFGDSISSSRGAIRRCGDEIIAQPVPDLARRAASLVSFGEDNAGELYMVDLTGSILRIVPR